MAGVEAIIPSYSKIYNLGHKAIIDLLKDPVVVEEKVDGSQFSFMLDDAGVLYYRSKGVALFPPVHDSNFRAAVSYIESVDKKLRPGVTYRGEVLARPRHNTLLYNRVPNNNVVIFDISTGLEQYIPYEQKAEWAAEIGLEVVPRLFEGKLESYEQLNDLLTRESFLGGPKLEGVVIKNYSRYDITGHVLMGKIVRDEFREMHGERWKVNNPAQSDILVQIIDTYRNERRWEKALQHMRDRGELKQELQDIGPLLKEINLDVLAECEQEIKDALWKWAWPKIGRGITGGAPEWYKNYLAQTQFTGTVVENDGNGV